MKKLDIPVDGMNICDQDIERLLIDIKKSNVTIFGNSTLDKFEKDFSKILLDEDSEKCVSLPNCTSAIFISLKLLNLKEGDEIIVSNLTHASAILPILYLKNVRIKVCDFSEMSYDFNIDMLKKLISHKTKAIIVSYLQGYPFNIKEVKEVSKEKEITLIEDAAQGLGVKIDNQKVGTFGEYSCFSFGANKLLKMGEGGALVFKDKEKKGLVDQFRHVGEVWKTSKKSTVSSNSTYKDILENGFDYIHQGFNFRFTPLHFNLGLTTLENMEEIIKVRQNKLDKYIQILEGVVGVKMMKKDARNTAPLSAWLILDSDYYNLNEVMLKGIEMGIPMGRFKYPLIKKTSGFEKNIDNIKDQTPNSDYLQKNSLFLPVYENIEMYKIIEIAEVVKEILLNYIKNDINEEKMNSKIEYFNGFFLK